MNFVTYTAVAAVALTLGGCGALVNSTTQAETDAAYALINTTNAGFDSDALQATPDMPDSGSAGYTGPLFIGGEGGGDFNVLGELTMNVDFGSGAISGTAERFSSVTVEDDGLTVDGAMIGTLTMTGDFLTTNTFGSLVDGTLFYEDLTPALVAGGFAGNFLTADGSGADLVYGEGIGTVLIDGVLESMIVTYVGE